MTGKERLKAEKERFLADYARISGFKLREFKQYLKENHLRVKPCHCGKAICQGWKIVFEYDTPTT